MFEYEGFGLIIFKMATIFFAALIAVRRMGNRAVGQLSPFDFVLMVGVGDIVANVALDRNQTLLAGAEGLLGLLILQQALAWLALKNMTLRKWFEGTPVVLIEDGRVLHENLKRTQFNFDDLRQELHKNGMDFTNIKDIKLARLESCGEFTVIKAIDLEPLTKRDVEEFVTNVSDNPLSPAGAGYAKLEQLAADVRVLAEYVKKQQTSSREAEENQESKANSLH